MKEELTTKMHSEFSVSREIEVRHKVGTVIEVAIKMNKTDKKSVTDIARLYGITYNDILKWKLYWENKGLEM